MNFAQRLAHVTSADDSRENFLTDGRVTCSYAELPAALETIDRHLATEGVHGDTCLAVECTNSVPGALLLIYLLQKGIGFMLLPPSENKDKASELKPIPAFCRHRLVIKALTKDDESAWMREPARFLAIEANLGHGAQPPAHTSLDTAGKLFVRTSGSMGAAKIVVHSQTNLFGNAQNCIQKYRFSAEDRAVIPVPIFHMYGFAAEFLPALLVGASMDLQANSNLLKYLDRERRFQPTIAFMTPNLCQMLLQGRRTPRPYKVVVTSGQRINDDVFRAFDPLCGNRLVNQYGSTEMGATAACDPADPLDLKATTIGQPMEGVQLRVDRADGTAPGELYCRHPYGYLGYVDDEGNWLYQAGEWYSTGDIAKINDDASIAVVGRADNSLNRSGYLVLLSDIEKTMETLENITHVTIVAKKGENIQGQELIAFCVAKPGFIGTGQQIRAASAKLLPKYAVPDEVVLIDSFPLLPSGKVDQQGLLAMLTSHATG